MAVAEDKIDLEEQTNPSKNGPMITMKSEINSCPRKQRHEHFYYTIKKKKTKLCTGMMLRKLQYCMFHRI